MGASLVSFPDPCIYREGQERYEILEKCLGIRPLTHQIHKQGWLTKLQPDGGTCYITEVFVCVCVSCTGRSTIY